MPLVEPESAFSQAYIVATSAFVLMFGLVGATEVR